MQKLYFAIQLLQMLCLGYSGIILKRHPESLDTVGDGESMRLKRQIVTTSRNYILGPFSQCSVTCGGGLRVRSVRCLNEDGVISNDCLLDDRPASYEFCNQIDCATSNQDFSLLPDSDTYSFTVGNYSSDLQFNNQGTGSYMAVLDTTESDGTGTILLQTVTPQGIMTQLSISPAMNMVAIVSSDGDSIFEVDGENLLNLNNIEQTDLADDDTISFQNNMIIPGSGGVSVDTLVFFDGFRYYMFSDIDLVNPLNGPGTLYFNPDTLQALYSTSISLNQNIDAAIASLTSNATEVMTEVTTISTPSSSTPDQTTTSVTDQTTISVTLVTQPSTLPPGTPSTTLPPETPSTTLPPETPSTTLPPETPSTTLPPETSSTTLPPETPSTTLPPETPSTTLPPEIPSTTLPPETPSTTLPPETPSTTPPPETPSTTLPPRTLSTTLPPATTNLATSLSPTSITVTTEDLSDVCDDDSTSSNSIGTSKSSCDEDSSRKKTKKSKKSRKSKKSKKSRKSKKSKKSRKSKKSKMSRKSRKSSPRRPGNSEVGFLDREDTRQDSQGYRGNGRQGSRGGRRGSHEGGRRGGRGGGREGGRGGGRGVNRRGGG